MPQLKIISAPKNVEKVKSADPEIHFLKKSETGKFFGLEISAAKKIVEKRLLLGFEKKWQIPHKN